MTESFVLIRQVQVDENDPTVSFRVSQPDSVSGRYAWLAANVQLDAYTGASCATVQILLRASTGRLIGNSVDIRESNVATVCGQKNGTTTVYKYVAPCEYVMLLQGGAVPTFDVEATALAFTPLVPTGVQNNDSTSNFSANLTVHVQFLSSALHIGEPLPLINIDKPVVPASFASSRVGHGNVSLSIQCAAGSPSPAAAILAAHNACPTSESFDRSNYGIVLNAQGQFDWPIGSVPQGYVFFRTDLLDSNDCSIKLSATEPSPLARHGNDDGHDDDDNVGIIVGLTLGGIAASVLAFIGGYALSNYNHNRNHQDYDHL